MSKIDISMVNAEDFVDERGAAAILGVKRPADVFRLMMSGAINPPTRFGPGIVGFRAEALANAVHKTFAAPGGGLQSLDKEIF